MTESADERTRVDRTEEGTDAAKDTREEYTSYREKDSEKKPQSEEARREAELQPGAAEQKKGKG